MEEAQSESQAAAEENGQAGEQEKGKDVADYPVQIEDIGTLKKGAAGLEKEIAETGKSRAELQDKIRSHDTKSAGLYT